MATLPEPARFSGGEAPLLSVIMPAYNTRPFIADAVNSLQKQTYPRLEVIVVDDGSSDGTREFIRELEASSAREARFPVRGLFQANSGPAAARNLGIAAATGSYIGFLDSDDMWHPEKAAHHIALMERDHTIALTSSCWYVLTEDGIVTKRVSGAPAGPVTVETLLRANLIGSPSTVVVRASAVKRAGGFDANRELIGLEDLDLWLKIALQDDVKLVSLGIPLVYQRRRAGQLTKNWHRMHERWLKVLARMDALAPERVAPLARKAEALHERYAAFLAYESGDYAGARKMVLSAWRRAPDALFLSRRAYPTTLAALASLLPATWHRAIERQVRGWREGFTS